MSRVPFRVSCDTVVAFPPEGSRGRPIFAKNSDRPDTESQPLLQVRALEHDASAPLRCTYIEIEQVERTHAFVGSRPHWLWGCEHGVNEHGLAIGNHTIYTRDAVPAEGLLGMDLVRLGLERAATASEAVDVITALLERYGQGGSGYADTNWPYNNSYLIADAAEGYVLETSGRHWVARRFEDSAAASNHTTIGADWDRISENCESHARDEGWWKYDDERFDFASAYRDATTIPPYVSSGRFRATCDRLAESGEGLDVSAAKSLMRDHYGDGELFRPGADPSTEEYFSVCMHAGAIGQTTASMVAELGGEEGDPRVLWVAMGNPCTSVYLPIFPEIELPHALTISEPDGDVEPAWSVFKALGDAVAKDFEANAERVHEHWAGFEAELTAVVGQIAAMVGLGEVEPGSEEREELLEGFMGEAWSQAVESARQLTGELAG